MPSFVMSEELGRPRAITLLRKTRPSLVIVALLGLAALAATVAVACDETGPSPIGEHFDDAGEDTAEPAEAGDDGEAGEEAGGDGGADAEASVDAGADADAADGD